MAKKLKKKIIETTKKQEKLLKPASVLKIKKKKSIISRTPRGKFKGKAKMIGVDLKNKDLPKGPVKLTVSAAPSLACVSSSTTLEKCYSNSRSPIEKNVTKCGKKSSNVLKKSLIVASEKAQLKRGKSPNTSGKIPVTSAKKLGAQGVSIVSPEKGLSETGFADTSGENLGVSRDSATSLLGSKKQFTASPTASVTIPKPRCRSKLMQVSNNSSSDDLCFTQIQIPKNTIRLRTISSTKKDQSRLESPSPSQKNSQTSEHVEEGDHLAEIDQSTELEVVFVEGESDKSEENEKSFESAMLAQVNTLNSHNQTENKRMNLLKPPKSPYSCKDKSEIPAKSSTCMNVTMGPSLVPANNDDQVSNSIGDLRDTLVKDLDASIQKEKLSNEGSFLSFLVPGLKQVGNSINWQKRRDNESPSPVRIRVNTGSRLSRREEFFLKKQISQSFKAYVKLEPLHLNHGSLSSFSLVDNMLAEFPSMAETRNKLNTNNLSYDTSVPEKTKLSDDDRLVGECGTNTIEDNNKFLDLSVSEGVEFDLSSRTSLPISEKSDTYKTGSSSAFPLSKTDDKILVKSILTPFPRKKSKSVSFDPHLESFPKESSLFLASSEVVDLSSDIGEDVASEPEAVDHKCLLKIEAICCSELEDSFSKIQKIKEVIKKAPKSAKYSKAFAVIDSSIELSLPFDIFVNVTLLILKCLLKVEKNVEPNASGTSISECYATEAGCFLKNPNQHSKSTVRVKVPRRNSTTAGFSHDSNSLSNSRKQHIWLENICSPEEKVTVSRNETPENVLLNEIEARLSRNSMANVCKNSSCSTLEGITPLTEYNLLNVDSNLNSPIVNACFDDSAKLRTIEEPNVSTKKETEITKKLRIKEPSRDEHPKSLQLDEKGKREKRSHERQEKPKDVYDTNIIIQESQEIQKKTHNSKERKLKRKRGMSDSQEDSLKEEKTESLLLAEDTQKREKFGLNKKKYARDDNRKESGFPDKKQKLNKKQENCAMQVVKHKKEKGIVGDLSTNIFLSPERATSGEDFCKKTQAKKVNSTCTAYSLNSGSPRAAGFTKYSGNNSPALFISPTKTSQIVAPIVSKTALKIMHEKKLAEAERASKSESPAEVSSSYLDLAPLTVSVGKDNDTLIIIPQPETLAPPKFQDLFIVHQSERQSEASNDDSIKGKTTAAEIVLKRIPEVIPDLIPEQAAVGTDIRDKTGVQEEKSASPIVENTNKDKVAAEDDDSIAETAEDVTLQDQHKTMLIDVEESSVDLPEKSDDSDSDLNADAPTRTSREAVEHPATETKTEKQSTTSKEDLLSFSKRLLGEEKEEIDPEGKMCREDAGKEITEEEATPISDIVSTPVFDLAKEPEPEPLDYEIDLEPEEELIDATDKQTSEEQRLTEVEDAENNLLESTSNDTQVNQVPHKSFKKICFSLLYDGICKNQGTCLYVHDLVNNEVLLRKHLIDTYSTYKTRNCLKIWKASLEKGFLKQYNTYYSLVHMLNMQSCINKRAFRCFLDHGFKLIKYHDKDGERLIWAMYMFLKKRHYICKSIIADIVLMAIQMKMVYILSDFLSFDMNPEDRVCLKPIFWQILLSLKDYFGCSEVSEVVSAISKINIQLLEFFATDISVEKQCVLLTALLARSWPSVGPPIPIKDLILKLRKSLPPNLGLESIVKINKPKSAAELLFTPPDSRDTPIQRKSAASNTDVFEDLNNVDCNRRVFNRSEPPIMPLSKLQRQQLGVKGRVNPPLEKYSTQNWLKRKYEKCSDNKAVAGPSFEKNNGFLSRRRRFDQDDAQAGIIEAPSVGQKPLINSSANVLEENGYIKNLETIRNIPKTCSDYLKLNDSEMEMFNSARVVPRPVAPVRPFPPRDLSMGVPYLLETPSAPHLHPVDHPDSPMRNIQSSTDGTVGLLQNAQGSSRLSSQEMEEILPSTSNQDTTVPASSSHFVFGQQIPKGFAIVRINNNRRPLEFSTDPGLNVEPVTESVSEIGPSNTVDRFHPGGFPLQFSSELFDSSYPAFNPTRPVSSIAMPEPGPFLPNPVSSQRVNTLKDMQLGEDLRRQDIRAEVGKKQILSVDTWGTHGDYLADANAPCQTKRKNIKVRKLFVSVFGKPGENQPNFCYPEDTVTNRAMKTKHFKVVADRISRDPENRKTISAIVNGLCVFKLNVEGLSSILEKLPEHVAKSPGIQKLCVAFTLELCRLKRYEELFKTLSLFKKHTIIYLSPDVKSPIHPRIEPHDILIELVLGLVRKGEWRHAFSILDKKIIQTGYTEKLIDNDRVRLLSQIIIKKVQENLEAPLIKVRDFKSEIPQIVASHESATCMFLTTLNFNSTDVPSLKDQLAPKFEVFRLFLSRKGDTKILLWRR